MRFISKTFLLIFEIYYFIIINNSNKLLTAMSRQSLERSFTSMFSEIFYAINMDIINNLALNQIRVARKYPITHSWSSWLNRWNVTHGSCFMLLLKLLPLVIRDVWGWTGITNVKGDFTPSCTKAPENQLPSIILLI